MEYLSGARTLDDLSTPVIICDERGIVRYKNKIAMKEIRLPRRNTYMEPHVYPEDRKEICGLIKSDSVRTVTINTGDRPARAFVAPYTRRGENCTLWVFVSLIQVPSSNRYTYSLDSDIQSVAGQICNIVKSIDENSMSVKGRKSDTFGIRMLEKIKKVVSYIFYSGDDVFYPVNRCISMLVSATEQTFKRFGYDIRYSIAGNLESSRQLIDVRSFSLFFFHLMAFFAECGVERSMDVVISESEDTMGIKLTLSMPYPPFYGEGQGDISRLADLSPGNIIDVLVFERLCEAKNYRFAYSINEDHVNNVNIFIDVPMARRDKVREERYNAYDEAQLIAYIVGTFTYMLDRRNFDRKKARLS